MNKKPKAIEKDFIVLQKNDSFENEILEERTIIVVGSTEEVDRANDVIPLDAWDLKNFRKNPIILLHHDYKQPIGKALWVKAVKSKGLVFKIQFHNTKAGNEMYDLYKEGFMNTFSVGFANKTKTKRGANGTNIFQKVELLELSCVTVPCNAGTEVLAKSFENTFKKDEVTKENLKELINKYLGEFMAKSEEIIKEEDLNNTEIIEEKTITEEDSDLVPEEEISKKKEDCEEDDEDKKSDEEEEKKEDDKKSFIEEGSNGGFSMNMLRMKVWEKAYNEGYWLDDIFPKNYPNGVCVAYDDDYNLFEFDYTLNENKDINFENMREVKGTYVQKDIGTKIKLDKIKSQNEIIENNKKEISEMLVELKSLTSVLKKQTNANIIKNELEKLSDPETKEESIEESKTETKDIPEEIVEEKQEESFDIKSLMNEFKDSVLDDMKKEIKANDFKSFIQDNLNKHLGKI